MKLREKLNGSLKSIIIGIITISISIGGTLYLSGQQSGSQTEKIKTIEEKTIPELKLNYKEHCDKQEKKEERMSASVDTLRMNIIEMKYIMLDMSRTLNKINKKLKIE